MENFNVDWMEVVFSLAWVIITLVLVPYIKSVTTEHQRETAFKIIKELVEAAEQLFRSGQITDRKSFVIYQASIHPKLKLEDNDVKIKLEAAVRELNQQDKREEIKKNKKDGVK
ncbi:MAG: hypothetical protein ACRDDX_10615 [Cellulosilyticaceae bacterium]